MKKLFIGLSACKTTNPEPVVINPKSPGFVEALAKIPARSNEDSRASSNALLMQNIGTNIVAISYGRPGVKGREIFGGLEKWGSLWRTGANEATVFATNQALKINGQALPAGQYAVFMIPNFNAEWEIIFNKVADQWGSFNHQPTQDALRIKVRPESIPNHEWLSFAFDEVSETAARLSMRWEKVQISFAISL
jgi:Protein of unknown function (DUF2911)